MAAAEQLQWRRAFPARALRRLGWFLAVGTVTVVAGWILFGAEPDRLPSGGTNPLAAVPPVATALIAALSAPFLLALVRRPVVRANHYALRVRPGLLRTLVLPWARVVEIACVPVEGEPLLLVRCAGHRSDPGDQPRWPDQSVLRAGMRAAGVQRARVGAFDLAVRMDEFLGDPQSQLATLAAWPPSHVGVTDAL